MEQRWLRYGTWAAGGLFFLAYAILFTDAGARREMAPWFVSTVASLAIVVWDERRLSKEKLESAFPAASRTLDVIAVAQLAVVLHFLRTRWPKTLDPLAMLRAYALSVVAGVAATLPQLAVSMVVEPSATPQDLPATMIMLAVIPLPLLLLWRFFFHVQRVADVESILVMVGLLITFGGASAVSMAIPAPLWVSISIAVIGLGALARAIMDRRGMNRS
jgi:hypothetical protein